MLSIKVEEIKELIEYGAPEEHLGDAFDFVQDFKNDIIALNLLHSFYSYPPEGLEDYIKELKLVTRKEGIFLICAASAINKYLYLVNPERAEFLGIFSEGIFDEEVLDFLGYSSKEEFLQIDIVRDLYLFPEDRRMFQEMIERDGRVVDYEV